MTHHRSSTEHYPWKPIENFFASVSDDPLALAFAGRRAVHPLGGMSSVPEREWMHAWSEMTAGARSGKSVAYVHVPFCETHCLFCGFYQNPWHAQLGRLYVDALVDQLRRDRDMPYQAAGPIHAVYFGGGTPTLLSARDLARAVEAVRAHLPLAPDCEITLEGRAHDLTPDKAQAVFDAGFNRVSIGVQSFDEGVRRRLGRKTARAELIRLLEELVAADRGAIVIDLIFGLPGQSLTVWESDVRTAVGIGLDGADLYALKLMPQTPLGGAARAGKLDPAPVESHGLYYARGAELMAEARWESLSSSHWRRGTRERNIYNFEVKAGANCLAFGAGAGGFLAGYSYRTLEDMTAYAECVRQGRPPMGGLMRQSPHHRLFNFITGSLERGRLDRSALAERLRAATGLDLDRIAGPLIAQWVQAGLLDIEDRWLDLTLAGRFWQVTLTQNLRDWLEQSIRERPTSADRPAALDRGSIDDTDEPTDRRDPRRA
jgi:anaerobilin synthase